MGTKKTSADLEGDIQHLIEVMRTRAIDEVRADLGSHIEQVYVTKGANGDGLPDDAIRAVLDVPYLAKIKASLPVDEYGDVEIPDIFRLGIQFAARLFQDPVVDY